MEADEGAGKESTGMWYGESMRMWYGKSNRLEEPSIIPDVGRAKCKKQGRDGILVESEGFCVRNR